MPQQAAMLGKRRGLLRAMSTSREGSSAPGHAISSCPAEPARAQHPQICSSSDARLCEERNSSVLSLPAVKSDFFFQVLTKPPPARGVGGTLQGHASKAAPKARGAEGNGLCRGIGASVPVAALGRMLSTERTG